MHQQIQGYPMNIQKFAELSEISAHTIRYYEKIGLLRNINRNSSGHRSFTEGDIVWADFIKRLKDTGMSLQDIRRYADLRAEGEHTAKLRMQLLQAHTKILEERIAAEVLHLQKLNEKIKFYETLIMD
jgi:DNA-binding transcriptional MerR regulator